MPGAGGEGDFALENEGSLTAQQHIQYTHAGIPRQDTHFINLLPAECAPHCGEGKQASGCSFVELWGCQKQGQHFRARVLEKIYRLSAVQCALYLGLILVY